MCLGYLFLLIATYKGRLPPSIRQGDMGPIVLKIIPKSLRMIDCVVKLARGWERLGKDLHLKETLKEFTFARFLK